MEAAAFLVQNTPMWSVGDHQLQSKAYLSPSDTSIDESVKSAQAGKDVSTL